MSLGNGTLLSAMGNFLSCANKKNPMNGRMYEDGTMASMQSPYMPPNRDEINPLIHGQGLPAPTGYPIDDRDPRRCARVLPDPGPKKVLCECLGGCCCALIVALVALLAFLINTTSGEVYGSKYTFWNYAVPQAKFWWAGRQDTGELSQWYRDLATDEDQLLVGVGPGPNTRTYYGWQDVKSLLEDFSVRLRDGTMKRYNEYGMQVLSSAMWPETGTISLGLTNSDHVAVRPYLGAALDGSEGAWDKSCDGSTCWNLAWLQSVFREQLANMETLTKEDLMWMVSIVLHKVHLNLEITEFEAKDFAAFQRKFVEVIPFKRNWFWEMILGKFPLETKADYLETYKAQIKRKWPDEPWEDNPAKLTVLASAMLDSLAINGGATVPLVLDTMLALMHMDGVPGRSIRPLELDTDASLHNFIWETLRRYPPVSGVPRWITDDGGQTWKHQIPNVAQALHDPTYFPEPLKFELGRPGLNQMDDRLSIGWADFAMVNNDVSDPNSHSCPGKQLSFRILTAFLKEFHASGPWRVDDPDITLNSLGSSGYKLRKSP